MRLSKTTSKQGRFAAPSEASNVGKLTYLSEKVVKGRGATEKTISPQLSEDSWNSKPSVDLVSPTSVYQVIDRKQIPPPKGLGVNSMLAEAVITEQKQANHFDLCSLKKMDLHRSRNSTTALNAAAVLPTQKFSRMSRCNSSPEFTAVPIFQHSFKTPQSHIGLMHQVCLELPCKAVEQKLLKIQRGPNVTYECNCSYCSNSSYEQTLQLKALAQSPGVQRKRLSLKTSPHPSSNGTRQQMKMAHALNLEKEEQIIGKSDTRSQKNQARNSTISSKDSKMGRSTDCSEDEFPSSRTTKGVLTSTPKSSPKSKRRSSIHKAMKDTVQNIKSAALRYRSTSPISPRREKKEPRSKETLREPEIPQSPSKNQRILDLIGTKRERRSSEKLEKEVRRSRSKSGEKELRKSRSKGCSKSCDTKMEQAKNRIRSKSCDTKKEKANNRISSKSRDAKTRSRSKSCDSKKDDVRRIRSKSTDSKKDAARRSRSRSKDSKKEKKRQEKKKLTTGPSAVESMDVLLARLPAEEESTDDKMYASDSRLESHLRKPKAPIWFHSPQTLGRKKKIKASTIISSKQKNDRFLAYEYERSCRLGGETPHKKSSLMMNSSVPARLDHISWLDDDADKDDNEKEKDQFLDASTLSPLMIKEIATQMVHGVTKKEKKKPKKETAAAKTEERKSNKTLGDVWKESIQKLSCPKSTSLNNGSEHNIEKNDGSPSAPKSRKQRGRKDRKSKSDHGLHSICPDLQPDWDESPTSKELARDSPESAANKKSPNKQNRLSKSEHGCNNTKPSKSRSKNEKRLKAKSEHGGGEPSVYIGLDGKASSSSRDMSLKSCSDHIPNRGRTNVIDHERSSRSRSRGTIIRASSPHGLRGSGQRVRSQSPGALRRLGPRKRASIYEIRKARSHRELL